MDAADIELRNLLYRRFVETSRAPDVAALPAEALRRLHDAHALVLEANGSAIRMLNPFSCVPTAYRVHAAGRWWYANCAWDAFGICAALQASGRIECSCPDCGEPLTVEVEGRRPDPDDLLFHVLVPAVSWWDDIVFT